MFNKNLKPAILYFVFDDYTPIMVQNSQEQIHAIINNENIADFKNDPKVDRTVTVEVAGTLYDIRLHSDDDVYWNTHALAYYVRVVVEKNNVADDNRDILYDIHKLLNY